MATEAISGVEQAAIIKVEQRLRTVLAQLAFAKDQDLRSEVRSGIIGEMTERGIAVLNELRDTFGFDVIEKEDGGDVDARKTG